MNLEDTLALIQNHGIEKRLKPIVTKSGFSWWEYQKDPVTILKALAKKGKIKYTQLPRFLGRVPDPERRHTANTLVMRDLENLQNGEVMVIPLGAAVFYGSQSTYMKKGGVLITKPLSEVAPLETQTEPDLVHYHQLRELITGIGINDKVVGYRFSGTRDTRFHTVLMTDILRAQILAENLDPQYVAMTEYSGDGKDRGTNSWIRSKSGLTFVFEKVPSSSDNGEHYKFTLCDVPAFKGESPSRDILQAAFNIHSPDHTCEKTRYYSIKRRRQAFVRDPKSGLFSLRPYETSERLMCHHIIQATLLAGRYLASEEKGWNLLNPFPTFNQGWVDFYRKMATDVFKERRVIETDDGNGAQTSRIVREPLTCLDMELLAWRRMAYLREKRNAESCGLNAK